MSDRMNQKKIDEALDRIDGVVRRYGVNRCYVAYSGGKDSRAVARLVRTAYPEMILIHNGHSGESIGNRTGVLCVKEPKGENVPVFLSTVDLICQFDGTRLDEDKTVIFDGKEIHRSEMPDWVTAKGVFDLTVVFPIWDWTEEDVMAYLGERE